MVNDDNIFFDKRNLKYCGKNVIIGKTVRIRKPQDVIIGDNVIIDDFTYIACSLEIGPYVHVSSNCSFIGGAGRVKIGAFSGIATGCRLITGSTNFLSDGLNSPVIPIEYMAEAIVEPIVIEEFVAIGANTVILPGVVAKQGMSVAAQSLLSKKKYREWMLYMGAPAKATMKREGYKMLADGKRILSENKINYEWIGKEQLDIRKG